MTTDFSNELIAEAIAVRKQLARKFEASDMNLKLRCAGLVYLDKYEGDFSYVLEMRTTAMNKALSDGQMKGVLNSMYAEYRNAEDAKSAPMVTDGEYTVDGETFKVETQPADAEFAAGEQIAYFKGVKKPWIGFGFVKGGKVRIWGSKIDDPRAERGAEAINAQAAS